MGRLATWVSALVALHCAFGASRVPHAVFAKRWREVGGYEQRGEVAWLLSTAGLHGREAIEELRRATPPDAVIPFRGVPKGAVEYAAALLWPRVCCFEDQLPPAAKMHEGRPVANVVLVCTMTDLRLEAR